MKKIWHVVKFFFGGEPVEAWRFNLGIIAGIVLGMSLGSLGVIGSSANGFITNETFWTIVVFIGLTLLLIACVSVTIARKEKNG